MQPRLIAALLAVAIAVVVPGTAPADQSDARLDGLFQRLQATEDAREAGALERRIWQIWGESDDPEVGRLMRQGVTALAHRELVRALDRFDRMVEVAPEFAEAWNKRATVYYLMGNFGASVRDIQRTLALEPRHFGALSGLGLIYDAIEKPAAALRSFEAALEINPHMDGPRERAETLRRRLGGDRT